jgi:hypothetical protein
MPIHSPEQLVSDADGFNPLKASELMLLVIILLQNFAVFNADDR